MDVLEFRTYLLGLQDRIIQMLQNIDGSVILDQRELEDDRSFARPSVITQGSMIEKAACNFTHAKGAHLPKAATDRRPELASKPFQATVSLSWIIHPKTHMFQQHMAIFVFLWLEKMKVMRFGGLEEV